MLDGGHSRFEVHPPSTSRHPPLGNDPKSRKLLCRSLRDFDGVVPWRKWRQRSVDHDPSERSGRVLALRHLDRDAERLAVAIEYTRRRRTWQARRVFETYPVAALEPRICRTTVLQPC